MPKQEGQGWHRHWRWHPGRTVSPRQFPLSLNPRCRLQKPLRCVRLAGFAAVFSLAALRRLYKLMHPQAQIAEMLQFGCKRRNKCRGWCLSPSVFLPGPSTGAAHGLRAAGGMGTEMSLPAAVGRTRAAKVGGNGFAVLCARMCMIVKI